MGADGYTPALCGFSVNYDHWQLCGLSEYGGSNAGLTLATVMGSYHPIQVDINVGPKQYDLPPLIVPCTPNTPGCPGSLPVNTVFTP